MRVSHSPKVVIVGGGIASFACGIFIRERLKNAQIELYTNADSESLGGHLSSWDEEGYPVEHGFHALFGFYEQTLKLLKRVDCLSNFKKSPNHYAIYRDGKINRFSLPNPLRFPGFSAREKIGIAAFHLSAAKLAAEALIAGERSLEKYDAVDLKAWANKAGIPKSLIKSSFFEQYYAAAFNDPHELSALVGLQSLQGCFKKPWHYYFLHPSKDALILPCQKYFEEVCNGKVHFGHELTRINARAQASNEIKSLSFRAHEKSRVVEADYFVLALGLEDFRKVQIPKTHQADPYFANLNQLQTVSSLSIQAWFKHDPVPEKIDTFIAGLRRPFSIVCPTTRVRGAPQHAVHPYELIGVGSEGEFEKVPDKKLIADFVEGLRDAHFKFKGDLRHGKDAFYKLRRNSESQHRYLLTRPGEWHLRPSPQSPFSNLMMAGAWVKHKWALPCVESAVTSALECARLIDVKHQEADASPYLLKNLAHQLDTLVLPPPFEFQDSVGYFFVLDKKKDFRLSLPKGIELVSAFSNTVVLSIFQHSHVTAKNDPSASVYKYNEVMLSVFARHNKAGVYPLSLYLDNDVAVAAGREVFGFPKKQAQVDVTAKKVSVARQGTSQGAIGAYPSLHRLIDGKWEEGRVLPLSRAGQFLSVPIYNHLRVFHHEDPTRMVLNKIVTSKMQRVNVSKVWALSKAQFELGHSTQDPLMSLIAHEEGLVHCSRGVGVKFSFAL